MFPRANLLSYSMLPSAIMLLLGGMLAEGGSGTSWTVCPLLSTEGHYGIKVDLTIIALHIAGGV